MKLRIFLYNIYFFSSIVISFAQIQPPKIKFINLEENWLYISRDTNFIKSPLDPYSTPYWGRQPQEILFDDNNIYILEITASQSPYSGIEGSLLHKLELQTGEPVWINHNNTYVGNEFREFYAIGCLRKSNDGNIEIIGYRDIDTIDYTQPQWWSFNGKPIKRIINNINGEFIEVVVSKDSLRTQFNDAISGFNRLITLSNGDHIQFSKNLYLENEELINSIDFYDIDDSMQIDTPFFKRIQYNTGLNIPISLSIYPKFMNINRDTAVISFGKIDTLSDEDSPSEFKLIWLDISEKTNIKEILEKDITELIHYPQKAYNGVINLITKDENIFVFQYYYVSYSPVIGFYWLAWYNKYGELLGNIDKLNIDNESKYSKILPMAVKNKVAYIAAMKDNFSYDILKIEPLTNSLEKIGQIEIENTQDISGTYLWRAEFLPNEKVLICMNVTKNNEIGEKTNFTYYYNFDMKDLGIITPTIEIKKEDNNMEISPNPAKNKIKINFNNPLSGELKLLDMYGRITFNKSFSKTISEQIDVSFIRNGMYVLLIRDSETKELRKKVMIVK